MESLHLISLFSYMSICPEAKMGNGSPNKISSAFAIILQNVVKILSHTEPHMTHLLKSYQRNTNFYNKVLV